MTFEYKVIPAPTRGQKGKGVKGGGARFAHAVELLMNEMGADGWEYVRAETLPSTERAGLTGSTTEWRNLLVFRRMAVEAPMRSRPTGGHGEAQPETSQPPMSATRTTTPKDRRFALIHNTKSDLENSDD